MTEWKKTSLRGKLHVKHGFPFKSKFFSDCGEYIVLTSGNFFEKGGFKRQEGKEKYFLGDIPKDYIHCKGDLIVAMTEQAAGLLGSCAIIPENDIYLHNQRLGLISVNESKLDKGFVYHLFKAKYIRKQLHLTSTGSKVKHTSPERIYDLNMLLPPIENQKKISAVLFSIDKKIELNNRINTELEAMAKTLYDYWFVQFDFPFDFAQGKPSLKGKPYKSSGGKMVFNKTLKREIPEGWESKPIADWIGSDKTGDWGKDSIQGNYTEQVSCIRGADINGLNGNGNIASPTRYILKKNAHKILESYDLIVEISGGSPTQSTGRLAHITDEALERFETPLICSNFCKAISLHDNAYFYNFIYMWNQLYDNKVLFGWEGKTSGIKNLLFDSFTNNYNVVYPDKRLAKKFYKFVSLIQSKRQKNLKENQQLTQLRDWLLPMLMNGQVTVK